MSGDVVTFEHVGFAYDTGPVLEDVTLHVPAGEFLAVVGPNGGGKTTLLKLILGLLNPDSGSVKTFGGRPVVTRKRIGYVPQDGAMNSTIPVTVGDVVLMGLLHRGFRPSGDDHAAAAAALVTVGMESFRNRPFRALSGGQRQRVLLARALAAGPDMLVLDEPAAHLDPAGQDQVYRILDDSHGTLTVVVAGHDVLSLMAHADTVAYVNGHVHTHSAPDLDSSAYRDLPVSELERSCPVGLLSLILEERGRDRREQP